MSTENTTIQAFSRTFPKFAKLPPEIRLIIVTIALEDELSLYRRNRYVKVHLTAPNAQIRIPHLPPLFLACSFFRREAFRLCHVRGILHTAYVGRDYTPAYFLFDADHNELTYQCDNPPPRTPPVSAVGYQPEEKYCHAIYLTTARLFSSSLRERIRFLRIEHHHWSWMEADRLASVIKINKQLHHLNYPRLESVVTVNKGAGTSPEIGQFLSRR